MPILKVRPSVLDRSYHLCLKILILIAVDLLEKMLNLDPQKRIAAADAITHPYVLTYQDSEDPSLFSSLIGLR
jgi:p38 MAP kinase